MVIEISTYKVFFLVFGVKAVLFDRFLWWASQLGLPEAPPSSLLVCDISRPRFLDQCSLHHQKILLLVTACCLGESLRPRLHVQLCKGREGLQRLGKPSNNITMATVHKLFARNLYCGVTLKLTQFSRVKRITDVVVQSASRPHPSRGSFSFGVWQVWPWMSF